MSGFNPTLLNETFFSDSTWKVNFYDSYGDKEKYINAPRLSFEQAQHRNANLKDICMTITAIKNAVTEVLPPVTPEAYREGMSSLAAAVNVVTTTTRRACRLYGDRRMV